MNQNIHPALRQTPAKAKSAPYSDSSNSAYSPIQPSPGNSYQYYAGNQPVHESPESQSPGANPTDPTDPNDLKRPRACEACRQLKVKCEPDESSPNGSCKRCAKAHRQCIVTVPSRKRQKKTDSRVAELEKKIDALTASLAARSGSEADPPLDPAIAHAQQRPPLYTDQWQPPQQQQYNHNRSTSIPSQSSEPKRKHPDAYDYYGSETSKTPPARFKSPPPIPQFRATHAESSSRVEPDNIPYVDIIDRNFIDAKTAYRCFDRYKTEMCKNLPIVVFGSDQSPEELRRNKPILFLAVLAVGCSTIRPDLQPKLIGEATRILGDKIIHNGEKSMELVQTIQLLTVFYQPPENYEELNFNQLVHMAAVMAMDIGMGKRSKKVPYPTWKRDEKKNKVHADPNSPEARRCWLGCYYLCTNSAMSLRRPVLIRWSPYADECVQTLTTAKDALPSDIYLCHLVKAQHIGEDIGLEFSMDDPASVLSLTDPKTQRHLKVFEQNLSQWRETGGDLIDNPIVKHTEGIVNLYMHEIAMHRNHNIDDFGPPYHKTPIEGPPDPDLVTPAHVESLTACLHSAHDVFEAFLSMDLKTLRALPTHFYVRNSYAAVALIKLYSAVSAKGSKFGSIFKTEELKVDMYLDRLIQTLQKVAEGNMSRAAQKFTLIFSMLKRWHQTRNETPPNGINSRDGPHQPLLGKAEAQDYKAGSLHPSQDASQAWSSQNRVPVDQKGHQQPARNGLQMLSEAAMGPGRSIPPQSSRGQWVPPAQMGQLQAVPGMDGMSVPAQDFGMMGAVYGTDPLVMGSYTSDDFMAFGLGDDWANFGLQQDGNWAY